MLNWLATLLERVGCFIFISEVISNILNNLWWLTSCEVGYACIYSECKWSASYHHQKRECLSRLKAFLSVSKKWVLVQCRTKKNHCEKYQGEEPLMNENLYYFVNKALRLLLEKC